MCELKKGFIMNKLFTKIATAFVGIAMATGVSVAIGNSSGPVRTEAAHSVTNSKITIDCTFNSVSDPNLMWAKSESGSENTITIGSYVFGYKNVYYRTASSSGYLCMRGSGSGTGVFYNKTPIPGITSIKFSYTSGTSTKSRIYVNQSDSIISTHQDSNQTDILGVSTGGSATTTGTYSKEYVAFSVIGSKDIQVIEEQWRILCFF